ncbi:MAG TPA: Trp family transcriptional regulator [Candidatus Acidoferrales bacterium]|nr:Trp family transcriptional regulator [Candidatus Acidoferrales bacterium]
MNKPSLTHLIELLFSVQSKKEMEALLRAILTPQELEELPKRLMIFEQLKKGTPQHEIAKKIGVGVATVTRGSLEIQRGQIQKTSWWQNLSQMRG